MEKVCRDWAKQAFGEGLVDAKYWDEFATNAQTAAAEVYKVKDFAAGEAKLKELLAQYAPKEIIAVGERKILLFMIFMKESGKMVLRFIPISLIFMTTEIQQM